MCKKNILKLKAIIDILNVKDTSVKSFLYRDINSLQEIHTKLKTLLKRSSFLNSLVEDHRQAPMINLSGASKAKVKHIRSCHYRPKSPWRVESRLAYFPFDIEKEGINCLNGRMDATLFKDIGWSGY